MKTNENIHSHTKQHIGFLYSVMEEIPNDAERIIHRGKPLTCQWSALVESTSDCQENAMKH